MIAWQRVRTANQLADGGAEWYSIVAEHNSGTYNNQYMIVDTKKFQAKSALQPGTLFVVEQIPGLVAGADVTNQLFRGYWPSYNGMHAVLISLFALSSVLGPMLIYCLFHFFLYSSIFP